MIKDKQFLIDRLRLIQRTLCDYDAFRHYNKDFYIPNPPDTCDCKFGMDNLNRLEGEQNGCPEMRQIIWMLEKMSDEEFKNYVKTR